MCYVFFKRLYCPFWIFILVGCDSAVRVFKNFLNWVLAVAPGSFRTGFHDFEPIIVIKFGMVLFDNVVAT